MLMNANDLGFSENEDINTADFNFEDNDLYLDSSEFTHDVESAGSLENFWQNRTDENEAHPNSLSYVDPYYENNPHSWDQRNNEINDELRVCEIY